MTLESKCEDILMGHFGSWGILLVKNFYFLFGKGKWSRILTLGRFQESK